MALTHTTATRNVVADAVAGLLDVGVTNPNGRLIYNTSGDVEVATLNFANPAFAAAGTPVAGRADANAIASDTNATGGVVAKCSLEDRNNLQALEGSVTATGGGGDIELTNVTIGAGDTLSTSSLTYAAPV